MDLHDNIIPQTSTLSPHDSDMKHEIKMEPDDDDNDLFFNIVRSIPVSERDDGVVGLNINTNLIGDNTFTVKGNLLKVYNDDSEVTFEINDDDLWKLLLMQRPKNLMELKTLKGNFIPAVKDYVDIVKKLNLIELAMRDHPRYYKNRSKYKLITSFSTKGSGFLFSVSPPPFLQEQKRKRKR